jgi:hypothetical protein
MNYDESSRAPPRAGRNTTDEQREHYLKFNTSGNHVLQSPGIR